MRYVLYHANCYDGFGAACSAWNKFGKDATYLPVSYDKPIPELKDATEIYILDFSYDSDILLKLAQTAKVVVLDHHKTAEEKLKPLVGQINPSVIFDMNKSGALLSWEYFHPNAPVPLLISYISDRDLWQFKLEGSKEVHAALVSLPMNFDVWNNLDIETLITEGKACIRFQNQLVEKIVEKSWVTKIDNYDVPVVNTSCSWSEVGHALLNKYPNAKFAASFTTFNNITMWSLRSEGEFDVSSIAKKYGGGGHKNAAGFNVVRV